MSAAILIFQICVAIKNHQRAFSLEKPHKLGYTQMRRHTHQHMHMVNANFRFNDFDFLFCTQLSQNLSTICSQFSIDCLTTKFRCKYQMILASPCCVRSMSQFIFPMFITSFLSLGNAVSKPLPFYTRRLFSSTFTEVFFPPPVELGVFSR